MIPKPYQTCENSSKSSKECSGLVNILLSIVIVPLAYGQSAGCLGVPFL